MGEFITSLFIHFAIGIIMIIIGISKMKKQEPIRFYHREKPLRYDEVTDVKAYNKKHGMMWIIFGVVIILFEIIGMIMKYSVYFFFIVILTAIAGIILTMKYHQKINNEYVKK